jgi:hypothetical protein
MLQQPLTNLNKTGLDAGILTTTSSRVFIECQDVLGDIDVVCEYNITNAQFSVGAQHLTTGDMSVDQVNDPLFICPGDPVTLDALLTMTANRYVLA